MSLARVKDAIFSPLLPFLRQVDGCGPASYYPGGYKAMGAALDRGDGLNLPDFGKGRIVRSTPGADGEVAFVLKLRRGGTPKKKEEKEALAEGSE